ncbi:MAG: NAD(P)H-dependent oxidoreductase [Marinicellaceae bacterium]
MNKVLVLFAHPNYQQSVLNKTLNQHYIGLSQVTFHDLYEEYPNFIIDIEKEQELLLTHDIIVFHHPLYWYSSPALLKEWVDVVFQHGFAYGAKGRALKNKTFVSVVTTGADSVSYLENDSIRNVMQPFERTARFCNMDYLPPFVIHGGLKIKSEQTDSLVGKEMLITQVELFKCFVRDLINTEINHQELAKFNTMNEWYIQTGVSHD